MCIRDRDGIVLEKKDFLLVHRKLRTALSDAQDFAIKRITNRGNLDAKLYYNDKIKRATELNDIDEVRKLQTQANRL